MGERVSKLGVLKRITKEIKKEFNEKVGVEESDVYRRGYVDQDLV
jgi:hypothetical protein